MEGAAQLELYRRQIAGDDIAIFKMLADFEFNAFNTAKQIQRNLYNQWGLG